MKRWWTDFVHVFLQWWIALDQLGNATVSLIFPPSWRGTWADETLSCRTYRAWADKKVLGRFFMPLFDALFFWQEKYPGAIGHCHGAYLKEMERYNMPPEMREALKAKADS